MRRRPSGSFIFSVALHAAIIVVLANIVLHYDIVFAPTPPPPVPVSERVDYVALTPPAGAFGARTATPPAKVTEASRSLVTPSRAPTSVQQPARVPAPWGTVGGVQGGSGAGGG